MLRKYSMDKTILLQCPKKFDFIFDLFYKYSNHLGFFDKYYLITDSDKIKPRDNLIIKKEKDNQFASNLLSLLEDKTIPDKFFFFIEDHIIINSFREKNIVLNYLNNAFSYSLSNDVGFLRLIKKKNTIFKDKNSPFRELDLNNKFYVDYQPAIWDKKYLLSHLKDGEDAWDSEKKASVRVKHWIENASSNLRSYSVEANYINILNCYRSGSYYREEFVDFAMLNNLEIDRNKDVWVFIPNLNEYQCKKLKVNKNKYLKRNGARRIPIKFNSYLKWVYRFKNAKDIICDDSL